MSDLQLRLALAQYRCAGTNASYTESPLAETVEAAGIKFRLQLLLCAERVTDVQSVKDCIPILITDIAECQPRKQSS